MTHRSISREVAEHLATSPEDRVYRRALRGLFSEGTARPRPNGKGQHNKVSQRFREALRAFEREGWLVREEGTVVVLDRAALWLYANDPEAREGIAV